MDAPRSLPGLQPGDIVLHSAFGEGVVVSLSPLGDIAEVRFDQFGQRRVPVSPPHDRFLRAINGKPYTPTPWQHGESAPGTLRFDPVNADGISNSSEFPADYLARQVPSDREAPHEGSTQDLLSAKFPGALYYMAPLDNLDSILTAGLLSKNRLTRERVAHKSIALEGVQGLRHRIFIVDQGHRLNLHDYVPLYFVTHNPMLAFRRDRQDDIAYIEVASTVMDLERVVFSDGNASRQGLHKDGTETVDVHVGRGAGDCRRRYTPYWTRPTRRSVSNLYGGPTALDRLPWNGIRAISWANDDELKREKSAETLVPHGIPATYFCAIHVRTPQALRLAQDAVSHVRLSVPVRLSPEMYFADAPTWYDTGGDGIQLAPPWDEEFEDAAWAASLARAQDEDDADANAAFGESGYAF